MTGKSRRGKGKYSIQSKKKKGRSRRPPMLAQQPAAAQTPEPASSPKVPVPSTRVSAPMAKSALVRYPYIATELRTSVILAGLMLIVLVVLALVLS